MSRTPEQTKLLLAAIKLLKKAFPHVKMREVKASVWLPQEDPGGWSPRSLLVVHLENGLPDVFLYHKTFDKWEWVEQELSKIHGKPVYFESINSAVTALHEV